MLIFCKVWLIIFILWKNFLNPLWARAPSPPMWLCPKKQCLSCKWSTPLYYISLGSIRPRLRGFPLCFPRAATERQCAIARLEKHTALIIGQGFCQQEDHGEGRGSEWADKEKLWKQTSWGRKCCHYFSLSLFWQKRSMGSLFPRHPKKTKRVSLKQW